ncbi:hypothetical protein Mapa_008178 [Marchantia paleacea]|nr:hypothetical protein Mapa_008178 [Marchantia paleacea]
MVLRLYTVGATLLIVIALSLHDVPVYSADPEAVTDFVVPGDVNASSLDGSFFTSPLLRTDKIEKGDTRNVTRIPVNSTVFPALKGLGVSFSLVQYPPQTFNGLHIHPRGAELLYVVQGVLDMGFIDSTNKLFIQSLQKGDVFVVPTGLVHFQINRDKNQTCKTVAAFSSSNPGIIRLRNNIFKSGISDAVLEKSFGVSADTIKALEGS